MHLFLEAVDGVHWREAEIEQHLDAAGDDIAGPGTAVDVRDLPARWREVLAAFVPAHRCQFGQRGCEHVDRVAGKMRIGDMALHALDRELARQAAAPAILDHVAQGVDRRRFADDAVVEPLAAASECLDDLDGPVAGIAFLIGGQQQCDRARMAGMGLDEDFDGGDKSGQRGLHVGRAAPVEHAVALGGFERIRLPLLQRTGRDDIGMAREAEQRSARATSRPEVAGITRIDALEGEADSCEAFRDQFETARVFRRDRATADQRARKFQRRTGVLGVALGKGVWH